MFSSSFIELFPHSCFVIRRRVHPEATVQTVRRAVTAQVIRAERDSVRLDRRQQLGRIALVPKSGQCIRAADMRDPTARRVITRKHHAIGGGHHADELTLLKNAVGLHTGIGRVPISAIDPRGILRYRIRKTLCSQ